MTDQMIEEKHNVETTWPREKEFMVIFRACLVEIVSLIFYSCNVFVSK